MDRCLHGKLVSIQNALIEKNLRKYFYFLGSVNRSPSPSLFRFDQTQILHADKIQLLSREDFQSMAGGPEIKSKKKHPTDMSMIMESSKENVPKGLRVQ